MKGKKLLAGLLSAAMVLGTMVMPAFADGDRDDLDALINDAATSEITLTKDATWGTDINKDITVDLNGKTVEITRHDMYVRSNVTFKNGNITMNNIQSYQSSLVVYGETSASLTFEGVNFTANGCGGGAAIIQANQNGTFITKKYGNTKTVITVNNTLYNGNMIQKDNNGLVKLEDTEIYGDSIYGGLLNITSIKNCKIELENIKDDNYGIAASNVETTIESSTITVEDCGYGAKLYSSAKLNFVKNSSLTITNSTYGDIMFKDNAIPTTGIEKDESSTITGAYAYEPYASVVGGYAVISNDRIYGDVTALMNKSLKVELWTETECIATTELKDGDQGYGDMIDGTERTVTFGFNYDANSTTGSDYWTGNYFNPTIEKRPVKVKVYVDGQYMCEGGVSTPTPSGYPDYDYKWNEVPVVYAPAKIGNVGYTSLGAALKAATDGQTITMYEDAGESQDDFQYLHPGYNFTYAGTLDLNGHKLTLDGNDYKIASATAGKNFVFKSSAEESGVIDITTTNITGSGIFWLFSDQDLKFENVIVNANNFSATGYAGYALINTNGGSDNNIEFVNSTLNVLPQNQIKLSNVIAINATESNVVFENSKVSVKNINGQTISHGNVTVKGDKSEININNSKFGLQLGFDTDSLTVLDKAKINITNVLGDDEWNPTKSGIIFAADTPYTVANTATVVADIYRPATTSNLANTVKVSFADVTENEGEKVYDIYVEADSKNTINRLMSVQMALDFETDDTIEMTVNAAEGLSRSFENGMYLFNFDGETRPSATGTKIKIGQVKFVGYGTFNLSINEDEDNKVHAAELNGENLVTDFIVGGSRLGKGDFDISASLEDVEIKVPTRKLTINITFPNTVEENVVAYQDMSVKIGDETIALGAGGAGGVGMENGAYVITKDLVYNTTYTVEVSGGGYRTARYTVTMNDNKTLNFWNNAKDNAVEVEVGKEASKKNTTFLAGELVKDGKINIYDLSAVVSYFGTINNVGAESEYAKYDLNRDGKIDSKDVAYVLVSWGK